MKSRKPLRKKKRFTRRMKTMQLQNGKTPIRVLTGFPVRNTIETPKNIYNMFE
jgi:hypothetical protein